MKDACGCPVGTRGAAANLTGRRHESNRAASSSYLSLSRVAGALFDCTLALAISNVLADVNKSGCCNAVKSRHSAALAGVRVSGRTCGSCGIDHGTQHPRGS